MGIIIYKKHCKPLSVFSFTTNLAALKFNAAYNSNNTLNFHP